MQQNATIAHRPTADAQTFAVEPHPTPTLANERTGLIANPGFGRVFTDHMVTIRYNEVAGWHDAKITPRAAFQMDTASAVLHYAQEIFEGLKAYRLPDGGAALFRPAANAARFRKSAERMAMVPLPDELFVESVRAIVRQEADWIPDIDGGALYLRPFMIASEVFLGVKPSSEYLYAVIASSVGAYFKGGAPAVTLWVSQDYTRAAPGGTGAAKCGGNYAASLIAQAEATRQGCDQVLFLDAIERRWIEELGGMNIFFVFDDGSIATPPLTGTILPGITRDSLLTLARDMGLNVREEPYAIDQCRADAQSGRLLEAFACGTAAVVTPIGTMKMRDGAFDIGGGGPGQTTLRLRQALIDIQRGHAPDPYGWLERVI
ncbi:branched-chain amino acid aminotransferase [Sphingomonas sp. BE270]|jgi:branched-chain amino acid aminotransferase|uniref:branched-chain amino acid aminotransferase n=1 Tax=unclassified Sphingomonas TaxID=196159 RepID=UPI00053DA0B6|nr:MULTISPECIES: branched-chain amino acid aminotransferase [unclassified Sphingomonas]MDR6850237.1 branched-chain amino acid aminotransferase [Sphingomonas sp. BE137]MDR7257171.1 branched-chain amino acid aminotransferase [Sphingomonas sp. BE270]RUN78261.1 branched-chain amino acid aminotransferase [Sphingomonas sp. TF3]